MKVAFSLLIALLVSKSYANCSIFIKTYSKNGPMGFKNHAPDYLRKKGYNLSSSLKRSSYHLEVFWGVRECSERIVYPEGLLKPIIVKECSSRRPQEGSMDFTPFLGKSTLIIWLFKAGNLISQKAVSVPGIKLFNRKKTVAKTVDKLPGCRR